MDEQLVIRSRPVSRQSIYSALEDFPGPMKTRHGRMPDPSPPRAPAPYKRLIVAADGTWLNSDNGMMHGKLAVPSNVTRISRAIRPMSKDGIPQIVYYHFGIGSQGGILDRVIGGAVGTGLSENIRECYSFLSTNYSPGDEIYLIGFSRGAFTARSVAGLIDEIGLLTKKGLPALPEVFRDVQHKRSRKYIPRNPNVPFPNKPSASDPFYVQEMARRGQTYLDITIKAIGVWDTVGSLGLPRLGFLTRLNIQPEESKAMQFYDTKLGNCIENAFQALGLDERRASFTPAVWEKPPGNRTVLRQVWFPGVHSNVGGGYDDQELANITLAWMMAQLDPFLDFNRGYVLRQERENDQFYKDEGEPLRPWSFGKLYNSMTGIYAVGGSLHRTPGQYMKIDPKDGQATDIPLSNTHEYIHPSVRTRIRLRGPGEEDKGRYEPEPMNDWRLVIDYPDGEDGKPDIFWKARYKEMPVKILPESPLWGIERELAEMDPETYDYVKHPPPTRARPRERHKKERQKRIEYGHSEPENGRMRSRSRARSRARSRPRSMAYDYEPPNRTLSPG